MIPAYLEVPSTAFTNVQKLAAGGVGEVYLAQICDQKLSMRAQHYPYCVAKVLRLETPNSSMEFAQEIALMNYLGSHHNIAKLIGYCMQPKTILMKHYPLGSLSGFIQNGIQGVPYRQDVIFNIVHGIACAIEFMHERQVAHCDLKPANVLLEFMAPRSFALRPLLADFGISRVLNPQSLAVTAFKTVDIDGVSMRYAAFEHIVRFIKGSSEMDGSPVVISRTDIYATGAIIYELLTRRPPWTYIHQN